MDEQENKVIKKDIQVLKRRVLIQDKKIVDLTRKLRVATLRIEKLENQRK